MKGFGWIKKWQVWVGVVSVLVLMSLCAWMGYSSARTEVDSVKKSYDEILSSLEGKSGELEGLEGELSSKTDELERVMSSLSEKKEEAAEAASMIDEANAKAGEIDSLKEEVRVLDDKIKEKKTKIADLDEDIKSRKGDIKKLDAAPVSLPSGTFIVGKDVKALRYSASSAGQSGNFVVYSSFGDLKVNQILGSDYGVSEHIFFADEGDIIESTMPTVLTPVE
ncbi:hypothetical protein ABER02_00430 [Rossellomorea marisflavi]|uniref:hypothetical protein n=1 Tax=Rossellomorea marisflavi TaxID=189381 RepID=UPI003D2E97CE